jgi:hypothetical protein
MGWKDQTQAQSHQSSIWAEWIELAVFHLGRSDSPINQSPSFTPFWMSWNASESKPIRSNRNYGSSSSRAA